VAADDPARRELLLVALDLRSLTACVRARARGLLPLRFGGCDAMK
jgi:hypothetical protein